MIPSNQTTQGFRKIIDNREYELRLHFKDNKVLANIKYYDRNLERYNKTTYGEAILQTEIISENIQEFIHYCQSILCNYKHR